MNIMVKKTTPKTEEPLIAEAPATENVVAGSQSATTTPSTKSSKKQKQIVNGNVYVTISYNNTLIAVSDLSGNIIASSSAGLLGFKGSKKSTPYAAGMVARDAIEKAKRFGLTNVKLIVKGIGPAREAAIRSIATTGLNIVSLMDATPVPHNGVKASKPRRV